jgi:hypothetical protein
MGANERRHLTIALDKDCGLGCGLRKMGRFTCAFNLKGRP